MGHTTVHVGVQLSTLLVGSLLCISCAWAGEPQPAWKSDPRALYDTDDRTIVKKARSGICHDDRSPNFEQTIHYTAYRTLSDCVASGGKARGRD